MRNYIAMIYKDPDSDYSVLFPDLPGCVTAGSTLDEARAMAEEALALHLEGMAEDGDAIPEPSSLEAVMSDPENRDGVAILVRAPVPSRKTVRVNVTFPDGVLEEIDRFAEAHGYTRSGFLMIAAQREISRETREHESMNRGGAAAPETGSGQAARATTLHPTQEAALAAAKDMLRRMGGGELTVTSRDGSFREYIEVPAGDRPPVDDRTGKRPLRPGRKSA